jgi:hypothetical protein
MFDREFLSGGPLASFGVQEGEDRDMHGILIVPSVREGESFDSSAVEDLIAGMEIQGADPGQDTLESPRNGTLDMRASEQIAIDGAQTVHDDRARAAEEFEVAVQASFVFVLADESTHAGVELTTIAEPHQHFAGPSLTGVFLRRLAELCVVLYVASTSSWMLLTRVDLPVNSWNSIFRKPKCKASSVEELFSSVASGVTGGLVPYLDYPVGGPVDHLSLRLRVDDSPQQGGLTQDSTNQHAEIDQISSTLLSNTCACGWNVHPEDGWSIGPDMANGQVPHRGAPLVGPVDHLDLRLRVGDNPQRVAHNPDTTDQPSWIDPISSNFTDTCASGWSIDLTDGWSFTLISQCWVKVNVRAESGPCVTGAMKGLQRLANEFAQPLIAMSSASVRGSAAGINSIVEVASHGITRLSEGWVSIADSLRASLHGLKKPAAVQFMDVDEPALPGSIPLE